MSQHDVHASVAHIHIFIRDGKKPEKEEEEEKNNFQSPKQRQKWNEY